MATKVRDAIKAIERDGWQHLRTTGCHCHFRHPAKPVRERFPAIPLTISLPAPGRV